MSEEKKIEVLLGPNGEIKIHSKGYKGKMCVHDSQFLKDALGEETCMTKLPEWELLNSEWAEETKKNFGIDTRKLCG